VKSNVQLGLPHRPPFVFVQELIACDPGISAECATVFRASDPIFAGHFPGNPLVPGVIITEALAQTAGIAAAAGYLE
jgi:3-hydroxyacyl-[acyl-carrier-protein] dehydratase